MSDSIRVLPADDGSSVESIVTVLEAAGFKIGHTPATTGRHTDIVSVTADPPASPGSAGGDNDSRPRVVTDGRGETHGRIETTIRDALGVTARATDRDDLERRVCGTLATATPYRRAVVFTLEGNELIPRTWAGVDDDAFYEVVVDRGDTGPVAKAVDSKSVEAADGANAMIPTGSAGDPEATIAAAPVSGADGVVGVLAVYADRPAGFTGREREALAALGGAVGDAIERIAGRDRADTRVEELEASVERLEAFASVVSHDLRAPLDIAEGYLEEARRTGDDQDFDEAVAGIERAKTIVDDMLALARADSRIETAESVDLAAVVGDAWRTVETDGATLNVDTDRVVAADRSQLRRVFENLFRNAIDHADADDDRSKSGRVTVRVGDIPDGFFLADDGPGIPVSDRESVFEPGYTTGGGGTGLGLAIVRRVAGAHGWSVSVTSGTDGGARFEFTEVGQ